MYRILKLNESAKLEEKDNIQDYKDFCKDMNINPTDQSSKDKYINLFSRMYAQYNGLSTLKAAKEKVKADLDTLKEDEDYNKKFDKCQATLPLDNYHSMGIIVSDDGETVQYMYSNGDDIYESTVEYDEDGNPFFKDENGEKWMISDFMRTNFMESEKLTEAPIDDEIQDELEDQSEEKEKQEDIEDAKENQEETVDSEEDQEENPIEEESLLDTQLDEIRDILIDLDDIRLYKIVSQDKDEFYILGKVSDNSDDVEMLVDTQPIDFEGKEETDEEITPEEIKQKFQFVTLPLQYDQIKDMNPKYGEDLETNHEEIMNYLMNLLIEQNPEAAEEHKTENKVNIEEPVDDYEEIPREIISSKEDEDEEE